MNSHPTGNSFCGVVFGGGDKAISHVPLLKSIINAVVIDGEYTTSTLHIPELISSPVSCKVTVTQTYENQLEEPTPTARYVFPVPSRAAICAFSMMTADNNLIYAKAKDKVEATKEFQEAVAEGKAAALHEKVSGDSQSFSCLNRGATNLTAVNSLQNFLGFYPSTGKNQDQDSSMYSGCLSTPMYHI